MAIDGKPLIVLDAGHGGWDNGASWNGRLEKEDNLRLALAVQKQLETQGIPVLMTRSSDVYVSLEERAAMANNANADLFISLHRNSYIMQTPQTKGVENFIYLSAPIATSGRAAQLVLDRVAEVGVQNNRGLQRGDYYVLRRTIMPAMLLEMGFIINEADNRLFDENLEEYAAAIASAAMEFFDLEFDENKAPLPPSECPACPVCPSPAIWETQRRLNERFNLSMPLSGIFDASTRRAAVTALQTALNSDLNAGLVVDGILGPNTLAAFPNVFLGQQGSIVFVLQALLELNGYDTGGIDGGFGSLTRQALLAFQRENNLPQDGVFTSETLRALVG